MVRQIPNAFTNKFTKDVTNSERNLFCYSPGKDSLMTLSEDLVHFQKCVGTQLQKIYFYLRGMNNASGFLQDE